MILSGEKILERVRREGLIENFDINCLEGAGYDLRVGRVYRVEGKGFIGIKDRKCPRIEEIKEIDSGIYILKSNEYVLIESIEMIRMPLDLIARILPRSTIFRYGCSLVTAVVDPGYRGRLIIGLKNLSESEFEFERGSRIAQIVFERVEGRATEYKGRYQGGNVV